MGIPIKGVDQFNHFRTGFQSDRQALESLWNDFYNYLYRVNYNAALDWENPIESPPLIDTLYLIETRNGQVTTAWFLEKGWFDVVEGVPIYYPLRYAKIVR